MIPKTAYSDVEVETSEGDFPYIRSIGIFSQRQNIKKKDETLWWVEHLCYRPEKLVSSDSRSQKDVLKQQWPAYLEVFD